MISSQLKAKATSPSDYRHYHNHYQSISGTTAATPTTSQVASGLITLNLSYQSIANISDLSFRYTSIFELDLSHNNICYLHGIEQFKLLRDLNLSYNNIDDFNELLRIPSKMLLKSLSLKANPLMKTHSDYLTLETLRQQLFPVLAVFNNYQPNQQQPSSRSHHQSPQALTSSNSLSLNQYKVQVSPISQTTSPFRHKSAIAISSSSSSSGRPSNSSSNQLPIQPSNTRSESAFLAHAKRGSKSEALNLRNLALDHAVIDESKLFVSSSRPVTPTRQQYSNNSSFINNNPINISPNSSFLTNNNGSTTPTSKLTPTRSFLSKHDSSQVKLFSKHMEITEKINQQRDQSIEDIREMQRNAVKVSKNLSQLQRTIESQKHIESLISIMVPSAISSTTSKVISNIATSHTATNKLTSTALQLKAVSSQLSSKAAQQQQVQSFQLLQQQSQASQLQSRFSTASLLSNNHFPFKEKIIQKKYLPISSQNNNSSNNSNIEMPTSFLESTQKPTISQKQNVAQPKLQLEELSQNIKRLTQTQKVPLSVQSSRNHSPSSSTEAYSSRIHYSSSEKENSLHFNPLSTERVTNRTPPKSPNNTLSSHQHHQQYACNPLSNQQINKLQQQSSSNLLVDKSPLILTARNQNRDSQSIQQELQTNRPKSSRTFHQGTQAAPLPSFPQQQLDSSPQKQNYTPLSVRQPNSQPSTPHKITTNQPLQRVQQIQQRETQTQATLGAKQLLATFNSLPQSSSSLPNYSSKSTVEAMPCSNEITLQNECFLPSTKPDTNQFQLNEVKDSSDTFTTSLPSLESSQGQMLQQPQPNGSSHNNIGNNSNNLFYSNCSSIQQNSFSAERQHHILLECNNSSARCNPLCEMEYERMSLQQRQTTNCSPFQYPQQSNNLPIYVQDYLKTPHIVHLVNSVVAQPPPPPPPAAANPTISDQSNAVSSIESIKLSLTSHKKPPNYQQSRSKSPSLSSSISNTPNVCNLSSQSHRSVLNLSMASQCLMEKHIDIIDSDISNLADTYHTRVLTNKVFQALKQEAEMSSTQQQQPSINALLFYSRGLKVKAFFSMKSHRDLSINLKCAFKKRGQPNLK